MALKDDINIPLIVTLGAATAVIVIITVLAVEAVYYRVEHRIVERRYDELEKAKTSVKHVYDVQLESLQTYSWADNQKAFAAVPIDVAIRQLAASDGKLPASVVAPAPAQ